MSVRKYLMTSMIGALSLNIVQGTIYRIWKSANGIRKSHTILFNTLKCTS